ncbi:acyl dehydratase [Rhodococcus sp. OAS809]|uniref:MaoC family dehydratase n=1 Tax=Rhodococcus sp. OAS809 TaxID=2663874 RepID=UPI00178BD2EB
MNNPYTFVRQRGLYFDELDTTVIYEHSPGRTVTDSDNTFFSSMTMNPASIHLDAHASNQNEFGQRLVNSMFTLSTLVGLSVSQMTQSTTVANLGFNEINFPAPVFAGDTLYASTRVVDKRLSKSRSGAGIVRFEHTARNQDGAIVAIATRAALIVVAPERNAK